MVLLDAKLFIETNMLGLKFMPPWRINHMGCLYAENERANGRYLPS